MQVWIPVPICALSGRCPEANSEPGGPQAFRWAKTPEQESLGRVNGFLYINCIFAPVTMMPLDMEVIVPILQMHQLRLRSVVTQSPSYQVAELGFEPGLSSSIAQRPFTFCPSLSLILTPNKGAFATSLDQTFQSCPVLAETLSSLTHVSYLLSPAPTNPSPTKSQRRKENHFFFSAYYLLGFSTTNPK